MENDNDMIGLAEATQLVKDNNLNDPRLKAFVYGVTNAAGEVLSGMEEDYLKNALAICMAMGLAQLCEDEDGNPDLEGLATAVALSQNKKFMEVAALIFKMAVGLSVTEEWK